MLYVFLMYRPSVCKAQTSRQLKIVWKDDISVEALSLMHPSNACKGQRFAKLKIVWKGHTWANILSLTYPSSVCKAQSLRPKRSLSRILLVQGPELQ